MAGKSAANTDAMSYCAAYFGVSSAAQIFSLTQTMTGDHWWQISRPAYNTTPTLTAKMLDF